MTTKFGITYMCLFAVCAPAAAKDLRLDCSSRYDLRYAGTVHDLVAVVPDAGHRGEALSLKCPEGVKSALFHASQQVAVDDPAATVRVTAWVKGDARGSVGFLCYDAKHRNVYISRASTAYAVAAAEGWKKVSVDYVPVAGEDYCNSVRFVMPCVSNSAGETVLVDDVSLEFLPASGRVEIRPGKSPSVRPGVAAGAAEPPSVPVRKTAPRMSGAFDPADWGDALCLGGFRTLDGRTPAREGTSVLLVRDARTLYVALVMDGERMQAFVGRQDADRGKAAWALPGVECVFAGEGSFLHLAFDYKGGYYSNSEFRPYVSTDHTADRAVVRFAVPLDLVPRAKASDLVTAVNFYRKSASGVTSWAPNAAGRFTDPSVARETYLDTAEKVADDIRARAARKAEIAARGERLRAKYGTSGRVVPAADWSKPNPLWKPPKVFGRDYWNAVITMDGTYERFRRAGIANDPFVRDALIWMWWERQTDAFLDPEGWPQKVLREHPRSAVSVKGMDRVRVSPAERERKDMKAYWNKDYAEKFLSIYDGGNGRFLGFWEDEAFVCDAGIFAETLKFFNLPQPKNRDEAYAAFGRFYDMRFDDVPERIPFRNVANASPYFHKYACNSAAGTFNHFTSALGDMMSGNETGDCMGPNPPKFAIARGAARQWGRPWRNYQTYYQWVYLESRKSGGLRCQYDNPRLLTPKCRYYMYGFCNGPDQGTDEARQKNTFLYPYVCGCGVYSSEASHEEILQWYDEEEIKTADPAVVAMRDAEGRWISPLARTNRHFYDEIVLKRDRGVTATPIGVVWDRANGYVPLYFGTSVWDFFAPTELEKTMWAFNSHVFRPYGPNDSYATSRFGDVFDIITNDAGEEFLRTYPVLMPVGDVRIDAAFAAKLKAYAEKGGTLVLNAALLLRYPGFLDEAFLGAAIGAEAVRSEGSYSLLSGRLVLEETPYEYRPLKPRPGVRTLAVTADDAEAPVITLNEVGRGRVILTAPDNMKVKGSLTEMLRLFDDLVGTLRNESLPIRVKADADVEYAICRSETSWLVYFNNNNGIPKNHGVYKTPPKTDVTKRAGAKVAIPKSLARISRAFDWWTGREIPLRTKSAQGEDWTLAEVDLAGGDCAVVEFVAEGAACEDLWGVNFRP